MEERTEEHTEAIVEVTNQSNNHFLSSDHPSILSTIDIASVLVLRLGNLTC